MNASNILSSLFIRRTYLCRSSHGIQLPTLRTPLSSSSSSSSIYLNSASDDTYGPSAASASILSLPYLEAIAKETMRIHSVAPLLPLGDPALWDAPEKFMQSCLRFVGSKMDVKGQDFELLPFGSGRRMCPGYNSGLKMIQLILANLLHVFTWRLPDGMTGVLGRS
ncbi:hypothetical protein EJB05_48814, partial [Eragrostis curvula]